MTPKKLPCGSVLPPIARTNKYRVCMGVKNHRLVLCFLNGMSKNADAVGGRDVRVGVSPGLPMWNSSRQIWLGGRMLLFWSWVIKKQDLKKSCFS